MPEELERKLRQLAIKKRLSGERKDRYIYGTMRKTGWTPSTQKSSSNTGQSNLPNAQGAARSSMSSNDKEKKEIHEPQGKAYGWHMKRG